jgi:hypothetical protein
MAAMVERLYQAVCAKPGESKATLAAQIGVSARELDRPMDHLKNDGAVKQRVLGFQGARDRTQARGASTPVGMNARRDEGS